LRLDSGSAHRDATSHAAAMIGRTTHMTRRLQWRRASILLALLASGCGTSFVAPFEGIPESPIGANSIGDRVAVCYNKMFSTPQQVLDIAVKACAPKTEPQLIDQDMRLSCPLMTPVRASFRCVPESPGSE
jgi:hypothetical protein